MKIKSVEAHVLEAPLSQPFSWSFNRAESRAACLVEITCSDGTIGWGECYGPAALTAVIVRAFAPLLVGADPRTRDALWAKLYNQTRDTGQKGLTVCAISGVDIALWDIAGKHYGVPIHELMGGPVRRKVEAYATGTYRRDEGDPRDYVVEEVRGHLNQGFKAVKLKIGRQPADDIALIKAVHEAMAQHAGRQGEAPARLMLDANHGYDIIEAIKVGRAVGDLNIDWFEEPVVPDNLEAYVEVRRGQPIPVAGGETDYTRWGFREIFTRRAMDIVQPDTCAAGGLSEAKKIADMAAAFEVRYVPHVWGTGVGLAAALHLLAVLPYQPLRYEPREPLLEFDRTEHPIRQAVLRMPIEPSQGLVDVPSGPGLGIDINREALTRFAAGRGGVSTRQ
ncbi:MAG: mandelate racemase/muconate lactonizing enzyme family protein [Pseudomonadota bacterium]